MDAEERYERLTVCLEALRLENDHTMVLVEGLRDQEALRLLGLEGPILVYNTGQSVPALADQIVRQHKRVIVLLDWDRTGGHLTRRLSEQLQAQVELDLAYRKELAIVSQVKCVEDLPAALAHLRVQATRQRDASDE